jgi:hypothetical protein
VRSLYRNISLGFFQEEEKKREGIPVSFGLVCLLLLAKTSE